MFNNTSVGNKNILTGYFGKLPGFTDFIKYNAAGKEILIIDTWLQEGLALAKLKFGSGWRNYYNNSSRITFIYPFTGTENMTLGIISPSNDKSGRSFPFLMFGIVKKNSEANLSCFIIPCAYKALFSNFNEIIELFKMTEDTSGLKSVIDNMIPQNLNIASLLETYSKFISETKVCEVFKLENENSFTLNDLFENDVKIFDHFISINYRTEPNQLSSSFIICFYIQLMQRVFKNANTAPGIFWIQNDDDAGILFLTISKPTPKDFIDLFFSNQVLQNISEGADGENKINYQSGRSIVRGNPVFNNNISLNEFLNTVSDHIN
ncbi:MAG: type VI secretion system-associated protein TagF [Ignavibacteriaceae bacterium]|nr:type VI secretion system-associated protein TagF [Ignavibacterium sp.]MCC6255161.1 type VI secretion system-associated protein TagF [Ignavibacteriaceae bacterium]HMN24228.1 type VI secretion system-associated protein TagF [Ignavibacteriaceae bacterium]HRN25171.1 type VI secretion system-associated protein TagF [Ignavibacteriaceae bacterium]HRP93174.1 type VI secretion system-associated protein TagF [Ignavibacteriaceae bacterium]